MKLLDALKLFLALNGFHELGVSRFQNIVLRVVDESVEEELHARSDRLEFAEDSGRHVGFGSLSADGSESLLHLRVCLLESEEEREGGGVARKRRAVRRCPGFSQVTNV